MSWHTPEWKIEQAILSLIKAKLDYEIESVQIVTRFSGEVLSLPRIEIVCDKCSPYIEGTGNWECEIKIITVGKFEVEKDAVAHDELCGAITDLLFSDILVDEINKTQIDNDIFIISAEVGDRTNEVDDREIKTTQEINIKMMPSKEGTGGEEWRQ